MVERRKEERLNYTISYPQVKENLDPCRAFRFWFFVHFQRKVGAGMPLLRVWVGDVGSRLWEN